MEGSIGIIETLIKNIKKLSEEDRTALECEFVHRAMNVWWNLRVSTFSYEIVSVSNIPCLPCSECENELDPQVQGYCYYACTTLAPCDDNNPGGYVTYTTYVYHAEPHDGLLTKSEQILAGASKIYEAKGCNHMQEQFWNYTPIANAFVDLFSGNAGSDFAVSK